MPHFLTREQIFRMISSELPEGVFAFGSPEKFYTTADDDSVAKCAESAYTNLERIYQNSFPQSADEKISDWEVKVFGAVGSAFDNLQTRRQNVLDKLRERAGISIPIIREKIQKTFDKADIISEGVNGVIGGSWLLDFNYLDIDTYLSFRDSSVPSNSDLTFDLVEWGCESGGWILDVSLLEVETYLGFLDPIRAADLDCDLDYAGAGISASELEDIQTNAFTYEVRITGTAEQRFLDYLENQLVKIEPARSDHFIYNNYPVT